MVSGVTDSVTDTVTDKKKEAAPGAPTPEAAKEPSGQVIQIGPTTSLLYHLPLGFCNHF